MPVPAIRRPLVLAAALVTVGAIGVSACASGEPAASPRTTARTDHRPPPVRWVDAANTICDRANAKASSVYAGIPEDADEVTVAAIYRDQLLPLIRTEIDAIAALDAPVARQDDVDAFIESAREAIEEAAQRDATELMTGNDPFTYASIQARKLGLSCGDDGEA